MVEIYVGQHNFTDPYGYISEVRNVIHVRIHSSMKSATSIRSWDNGSYAPRFQLAIL